MNSLTIDERSEEEEQLGLDGMMRYVAESTRTNLGVDMARKDAPICIIFEIASQVAQWVEWRKVELKT